MSDIYKIVLILALLLTPSFTKTKVVNVIVPRVQSSDGILEEKAKIPEDFVSLEGAVIGREGDLVVINLGEKHGVRKDMRLFVYKITGLARDEAKNIIGMERIPIGVFKIDKLEDETSMGSIQISSFPVEIGDLVGTR
ncbi:MAG: hypothetical protein QME40_04685 [bacterium]|nr:hypothetical protein [bacterium]